MRKLSTGPLLVLVLVNDVTTKVLLLKPSCICIFKKNQPP